MTGSAMKAAGHYPSSAAPSLGQKPRDVLSNETCTLAIPAEMIARTAVANVSRKKNLTRAKPWSTLIAVADRARGIRAKIIAHWQGSTQTGREPLWRIFPSKRTGKKHRRYYHTGMNLPDIRALEHP
jgi:hypothetical protein